MPPLLIVGCWSDFLYGISDQEILLHHRVISMFWEWSRSTNVIFMLWVYQFDYRMQLLSDLIFDFLTCICFDCDYGGDDLVNRSYFWP